MAFFPDRPFDDAGALASEYFALSARAAATVDLSALADAGQLLLERVEARRWIYACGNGGSAAIANHLVCDCLKGARTGTAIRPKVHSLSCNIELVTALVNDMDPHEVFAYQLESLAASGDVLIAISSSGGSPNIIRALEAAKEAGMSTIAMTGFDGGPARRAADVSLHVDAANYGVIEDAHQSLMHILAQFLRQARLTARDQLGGLKF
ncbi:MAG TPA: SIS domain-containing protein [Caulobacteraceae bacterium]|jgi:phosphoheptose isomerase|nr:SIS domain-containing protein [Caulobacteraceae bacterium]